MGLSEAQQRAWRALGLGPLWRLRADQVPGPAAAAAQPVGRSDIPSNPVRPDQTAVRVEVLSAAFSDGRADRPEPDEIAFDNEDPGAGLDREPPVQGGEADPIRTPARLESRAPAVSDWPGLRTAVATCERCGLCQTRTQTVFGVGSQRARLMVIGEAPGAEEDLRGEPFVGQAGRLLDNMLAALGLSRERDVFIANVLKCRPPGNRNPLPEEIASCLPYLRRQVAWLDPDVILLLGRFAAQTVLQKEASIASLRGQVHQIAVGGREISAVVSYHPAYLLRSLGEKAKAWRDLERVGRLLAAPGRPD